MNTRLVRRWPIFCNAWRGTSHSMPILTMELKYIGSSKQWTSLGEASLGNWCRKKPDEHVLTWSIQLVGVTVHRLFRNKSVLKGSSWFIAETFDGSYSCFARAASRNGLVRRRGTILEYQNKSLPAVRPSSRMDSA